MKDAFVGNEFLELPIVYAEICVSHHPSRLRLWYYKRLRQFQSTPCATINDNLASNVHQPSGRDRPKDFEKCAASDTVKIPCGLYRQEISSKDFWGSK